MAAVSASPKPAFFGLRSPRGGNVGGFFSQRSNKTLTCSLRLPSRIGPLVWPWEKVKIGPLSVSPMGFGTWAWGNQLLWGYQEEMDASLQATFDLAVRNGITLFDTADSYGTGRFNGRSEMLLGKFIREYKDMDGITVGVALSNSSRETLLQLTNEMERRNHHNFGPVLEAQVASGEAFRCCAHAWTTTHDKLLLKAHKYFIRTHHDDSKKFLLLSGWKKVQEKFKLMDQHIVGLNDLQTRFFALKRGVTELPEIVLYRIWSETEDSVINNLYEEIMLAKKPQSKKFYMNKGDYVNMQQNIWYYLKCCPEVTQIERRLSWIMEKEKESNA